MAIVALFLVSHLIHEDYTLSILVCHIFLLTLHQFQAAAVVQEGLYRKGVIEIIFYTQTSQL